MIYGFNAINIQNDVYSLLVTLFTPAPNLRTHKIYLCMTNKQINDNTSYSYGWDIKILYEN